MDKTTIFSNLFHAITYTVGNLFTGSMAKYERAAQSALKAAMVRVDGSLDALLSLYHSYEGNHPLVKSALDDTRAMLVKSGVVVIDADNLERAVKIAIHDLVAPLLVAPEAAGDAPADSAGASASAQRQKQV